MIFLTLVLSLFTANAADLDAIVAAGVGKSILDKHQAFERYGQVGIRYGGPWKIQVSGGGYATTGDGERSSFYGSVQTGLDVVSDSGTFGQMLAGPGYVSRDDSKLTGNFQFHLTGGVGYKNTSGYGLGVMWNHFSNAGTKLPNLGRDIISVQMILPLYRGK